PLKLNGEIVRPSHGRHWALGLKPGETVQEAMDRLWREGRIWHQPGKMPAYRRYLDEMPGVVLQDVWTDIRPIAAQAAERLGYPTQKPEALLERVLKSSSNPGDLVLDPFCGCGTTVFVAHKLERNWVGIDITHLAIGLIKSRLQDSFGAGVSETYQVIGEPVDFTGAVQLAKEDPFQFQWWALGLVGARPVDQTRGRDQGIDGRLYFHDEEGGRTKQVILSVKAGENVSVAHVRDLRGVIEREKAEIGVFISLEEPTKAMTTEAASAGFYKSPWGNHPRLQILTIAELLAGKRIDYPPTVNVTFKKAPRSLPPAEEQLTLPHAPEKSKKRKPR
ncbi:MAG: DNA methyltransferase, partial [Terriglobia bacterium]